MFERVAARDTTSRVGLQLKCAIMPMAAPEAESNLVGSCRQNSLSRTPTHIRVKCDCLLNTVSDLGWLDFEASDADVDKPDSGNQTLHTKVPTPAPLHSASGSTIAHT